MKNRILSIITIMAMIFSMVVPTFAGNGDNTGDDIFEMSMYIDMDASEGAYTLGETFSFTATAYVGDIYKQTAVRNISITGPAEVSNFQFKNDDNQWKSIDEFNITDTIYNEIDREFQVAFTTAGTYEIVFKYTTTAGQLCGSVSKYITITETSYSVSDKEPTTPEVSSSDEPSSGDKETTTPEESSGDEPSSGDKETTTPEQSSSDEPSSDDQTTEQPTVVDPTTKTPTTVAPTTTKKVTPPAKTKVKSASKKNAAKQVKISIKKVKGANGYRVQFGTTKKFKKVLVTKNVKKATVTISNKKLKNKKKLYVRVKAYKLDGKKKVLAKKWSNAKKVKIKN